MKAILIFILLTSTSSSYAVTLKCEEGSDIVYGATALIDEMDLSCRTKSGQYYVHFWGIGPGLSISLGYENLFYIHCPLVKESKIKGNFYGLKVEAGVHAGAMVGAFSNKRLGLCFMEGVALFQYGAGATIDRMRITD